MEGVTNWDRYYKRIKISQITLGLIWKAYPDLLRGIHFQEPIKIIELGCGTAYNTLQLSKLFRIDKVTLVDSNPNVLNVTRKRLSCLECAKEFLLQDVFDLNLTEKYDIVHSQGLLEHFTPERQRELVRIHRDLLTDSGVTIILAPTPSLPYRLWRGTFEKLNLWIYLDETAVPEVHFRALLEHNDLQILKMRKYHLMELGAVCKRRAA